MKILFAALLAVFVLSNFDMVDSSYDKIVYHSKVRARKEGPNVCALQQVMGTKKKYFSTCRNWYQGAILCVCVCVCVCVFQCFREPVIEFTCFIKTNRQKYILPHKLTCVTSSPRCPQVLLHSHGPG
ncbi:unnamed protein product [Oncorhynchus mykiss]|uniref:Uncharacterized protein n=1 Tax=Oncorhynchus mykiss TaxID=8022 RepID=A0A060XZ76_ONCMY|nr:unnamed protein product [Oncorhynchus mykiss]